MGLAKSLNAKYYCCRKWSRSLSSGIWRVLISCLKKRGKEKITTNQQVRKNPINSFRAEQRGSRLAFTIGHQMWPTTSVPIRFSPPKRLIRLADWRRMEVEMITSWILKQNKQPWQSGQSYWGDTNSHLIAAFEGTPKMVVVVKKKLFLGAPDIRRLRTVFSLSLSHNIYRRVFV